MPSIFEFNGTLGAAFVGYSIALALYGTSAIQTYIYYSKSSRDRPFLRHLVGFLFVLDTLHVVLIAHALYFYTVTNFTNILALTAPVWSLGASTMVTVFSDLLIRFVFGQRIWKLSDRNWWLAALMAATSLTSFGMAFTIAVESLHAKSFLRLFAIKSIFIAGLTSSVVADAIIAASLWRILSRHRSDFVSIDSVINLLILYGISTGAATALCAVIVLVSYLTMPKNFIWLGAFFVIGKLFLNSLLVSLNNRETLMERNVHQLSDVAKVPDLRTGPSLPGCCITNNSDMGLAVKVERTMQVSSDDHEPGSQDSTWEGYGKV